MKRTLLSIAMLAFIFTGCNDDKKSQNPENISHEKNETITNEDHNAHDLKDDGLTNNWTSEMEKNDGAKWEANSETNEGVLKMQILLKTEDTTTLEDYHQLAAKLNSEKNYVVKNCTMKGASHDNLHTWLLPLMSKIEALSESQNLEEAKKIKHSISENVDAYEEYFE